MEFAIIPRFLVRKLLHDESIQLHANVLISSLIILLAIIMWSDLINRMSTIPHQCVIQKTIDAPCPGCGVTRSLVSTAKGEFLHAWQLNPGGFCLFLYLIVQIPIRLIAIRFSGMADQVMQLSRAGSIAVITILFLVWIVRLNQQ